MLAVKNWSQICSIISKNKKTFAIKNVIQIGVAKEFAYENKNFMD